MGTPFFLLYQDCLYSKCIKAWATQAADSETEINMQKYCQEFSQALNVQKEGKEAGLGKGGRRAAKGCQKKNQTKLQGALKTR